jgi:hypothetical protein
VAAGGSVGAVVGGTSVGGTAVGGTSVGGTAVGAVVAGACVAAGATVVAGAHAAKIMLLRTNKESNCNVIFFMFFSYFIVEYDRIENLDFTLIDN